MGLVVQADSVRDRMVKGESACDCERIDGQPFYISRTRYPSTLRRFGQPPATSLTGRSFAYILRFSFVDKSWSDRATSFFVIRKLL